MNETYCNKNIQLKCEVESQTPLKGTISIYPRNIHNEINIHGF